MRVFHERVRLSIINKVRLKMKVLLFVKNQLSKGHDLLGVISRRPSTLYHVHIKSIYFRFNNFPNKQVRSVSFLLPIIRYLRQVEIEQEIILKSRRPECYVRLDPSV